MRGQENILKGSQIFKNRKIQEEFIAFLDTWNGGESRVRASFLWLKSVFLKLDGTRLDFLARPGVSYSLRAWVFRGGEERLFTLVDVIDDDPENRWLSVCFYAEAVSDPKGLGNLIPGGILGNDGYCFDVFEEDVSLLGYLEARIREAFEKVMPGD
jgi:hypothetical protein